MPIVHKKDNNQTSFFDEEDEFDKETTPILEGKTNEQMRMVIGINGEFILPELLKRNKSKTKFTRASSRKTCISRQNENVAEIDPESIARVKRLAVEQRYLKTRKFLTFQTPSREGENYKPLLDRAGESSKQSTKSFVVFGSSFKPDETKINEQKPPKQVVASVTEGVNKTIKKSRRKGTPLRSIPFGYSSYPKPSDIQFELLDIRETEYPHFIFIEGWYYCDCGDAVWPPTTRYHKCPYMIAYSKNRDI